MKSKIAFTVGTSFAAILLILAAEAPPKYATVSQIPWTNTGSVIQTVEQAAPLVRIEGSGSADLQVRTTTGEGAEFYAFSGVVAGYMKDSFGEYLTVLDPMMDLALGRPYSFASTNDFAAGEVHTDWRDGSTLEIMTLYGDGTLAAAGKMLGTNGLASFSTVSTNQIATTGWTNNAAINVTVYTTATAVSFTINNRAGTVLYTSPTLTATVPVNLQPGWSIRAASGLTGTVLPF